MCRTRAANVATRDTVGMVLKLPDDVPIVWRSPTSLQLGIDAPQIVLDDVGAGDERLIAALRRGISPSGWSMLARDAGLSEDRARGLLAALEPLLSARAGTAHPGRCSYSATARSRPPSQPCCAMPDASRRPTNAGRRWSPSSPRGSSGPRMRQHWLRRDVPHLPIVAADRSVTVGPLVEPGTGPCLYCGQLTRTDADPAWPAIAAQLWGRAAPHHSLLAVGSVAAFAARLLLARLDSGSPDPAARAWRLADEGGTISVVPQLRHPRCSCAAPPESDWAPGSDHEARDATTTGRAGSVPA